MRITKVKVLPVEGDDKLKAYVTIKIEDAFVIRDMKVIKGATNYFVAMPSKKMKDGTHRDIIHPLGKETRQMLEDQILDEFHRVCSARDLRKPVRSKEDSLFIAAPNTL